MSRPQTKVSANLVRSIISRYKSGNGLVAISEALDLGVGIIRRVLTEAKVKIRKQGRPCTA